MSLQGSKPKKIIKRINYHNPTYNSYSIMESFNPQYQLLNMYRKENQNGVFINSNSNNKRYKQFGNDSLFEAQKKFDQKKVQQINMPNDQKQKDLYNYNNSRDLRRGLSNDQKDNDLIKKNKDQYNSLNKSSIGLEQNNNNKNSSLSHAYQMGKLNNFYNYLGCDSIKYKQYHGFNIISGVSGYYG